MISMSKWKTMSSTNKGLVIALVIIVAFAVPFIIIISTVPASGQTQRPAPREVNINEKPGFTPYLTFMTKIDFTWYVQVSVIGYSYNAPWLNTSNDTIQKTLKVNSLYCANGTGHVLFGNGVTNASGYIVFDFQGKWFMAYQVPISVMPQLVQAIILQMFPLTLNQS